MKDREFIELRNKFSEQLEPKCIKSNIDAWNFYINSTKENQSQYEASTEELYKLYKNEEIYGQLLELKEYGLKDNHLAKQLKDLLREFDEELNSGELKKLMRDKENEIASKYNSYVPIVNGKEISSTEINQLLQKEKNVYLRKQAYNAKIKGGDLIAKDLLDLVKLRNQFAQTKGYKNFFEYNLKEGYDVDINYLESLLEDVHSNANELSFNIQSEAKNELATAYSVKPEDLKGYHYGLLLDTNPVKDVNKHLKSKEQVVEIAKTVYKNMGYDIDKLPIILDLFPRKNKNTHGFCFDIQAGKDARILANLTNDSRSIDTLCHELGHCVYHLGIDTDLPYLDQQETPALTEAIAMMMGDLQQRENVLKGIVPNDTLEQFKSDYKKSEAKFISRCMLIIDFEKSMYENSDQDLAKLWHDLRVKYTLANNSEDINNEWATIPHYLSHPAYYQNYFRADIMKSQIYNKLCDDLGNISENSNTAEYLNNNLFKYGLSIDENELIEQFTGEPLSSKSLCKVLSS